MNTYKTSEIARHIGIHPNTVRLYEAVGLIPPAERRPNGYRMFTDFHLEQLRLARTALQVEVLQNGLRKMAIDIIRSSASCDFDTALRLAEEYRRRLLEEQKNAEDAIEITRRLLSGGTMPLGGICLTRKETSGRLQVTMDTLRNWEMNGLLTVRRRQNGYRVYMDEDIRRIKIIRSLRCAGYSLSSILRMLNALSEDPAINIREVINTPDEGDDIISVCDRLLVSLGSAERNAVSMLARLRIMKKRFC